MSLFNSLSYSAGTDHRNLFNSLTYSAGTHHRNLFNSLTYSAGTHHGNLFNSLTYSAGTHHGSLLKSLTYSAGTHHGSLFKSLMATSSWSTNTENQTTRKRQPSSNNMHKSIWVQRLFFSTARRQLARANAACSCLYPPQHTNDHASALFIQTQSL